MDSPVLCSFKIGKPKCNSEITYPATSNTTHSLHKTSRGGKHPLLLPGANSHAKPKSRYFLFSKTLALLQLRYRAAKEKPLSFTSERRCICPSWRNSPIHRDHCFLLFFLRYLYPKGKNLIILLCPSWPGNRLKYSNWKLGLCFPEHMLSVTFSGS